MRHHLTNRVGQPHTLKQRLYGVSVTGMVKRENVPICAPFAITGNRRANMSFWNASCLMPP